MTLPNQERLLRVFAFSCDAANNCAAPVQTFVIRDVTPPAQQNGASFAVAAAGSVVVGGVTILPSPLYVINTGSARSAGDVAVVDEAGAAVADVHAFRFSLSRATLQNASLQSFSDPPSANSVRSGADIVVPALPAGSDERTVFASFTDAAGNTSQEVISARVQVDVSGPTVVVSLNGDAPTSALSVPFTATVPAGAEAPTRLELSVDGGAPQAFAIPLDAGARLNLPATEGLRRVVVNAFDRVNNVTRQDLTILADRSAPRVDSARCTSLTCVDSGVGELVSRAADARADIAVSTFDAFTSVVSVDVSFEPPLAGGTQTVAVNAGSLRGVLLPAG